MKKRPDITAMLADGEELVWHGHPKPGRPTPLRAHLIAALLYAVTIGLGLFAWYLGIWWDHRPGVRPAIYLIIAAAAFLTFMGLNVTVLQRRRARSRDAATAYGITSRRALAITGSYKTELALGPGVKLSALGGTLTLSGPEAKLRFERLADVAKARAALAPLIGAAP